MKVRVLQGWFGLEGEESPYSLLLMSWIWGEKSLYPFSTIILDVEYTAMAAVTRVVMVAAIYFSHVRSREGSPQILLILIVIWGSMRTSTTRRWMILMHTLWGCVGR